MPLRRVGPGPGADAAGPRPRPDRWQHRAAVLRAGSGDVLFDPSLPLEDVNAGIHTGTLLYGRTFGFFGRSANAIVSLPCVWGDIDGLIEGEYAKATRSGLSDLRAQMTVNLVGGPALTPREFAAQRQNTQDNDDYFGGLVREQDPIGTFQAHLSDTFKPRLWLAADATFYAGGRTTVDGVARADLQSNSRLGMTLALPVGRRSSVKVASATGFTTRFGADFDSLGVAWQTVWFSRP